jgi:hypothetical protein
MLPILIIAQDEKRIEFTGGARSLLTQSSINPEKEDTVTFKKQAGGYALIDLGIKIKPNSSTEILGMLRIKNEFGGFWGSGVTFDVRQLYVRGIAAKKIKYQLGNIDHKLTPFTFFNHNSDLLTNSIGFNRIKQEVINYETFYSKNTWRQQGAVVDFALKFPDQEKRLLFNGFVSHLNPAGNLSLERMFGGGKINFVKDSIYALGVNFVSVFDIKGTSNSTAAYRNNVTTLNCAYTFLFNKIIIKFDGESGSSNQFDTDKTFTRKDDYFVYLNSTLSFFKNKLRFKGAYINVGPDFRSAGAQSMRVDYTVNNSHYQRYTNDQVIRGVTIFDLYNDANLYRYGISTGIMNFNPAINNVQPYGLATFNRVGLISSIEFNDSAKIIGLTFNYNRLQEIRGQGTLLKRNFQEIKSTLNYSLSKQFKWKKTQLISVSSVYQYTKRNSPFEYEKVDLNSYQVNIGMENEFVKGLSFVGNYFMMNARGNEILPLRNEAGNVTNFNSAEYIQKQEFYSVGLKYNFSEKTHLSLFIEQCNTSTKGFENYSINQALIYYIMKF